MEKTKELQKIAKYLMGYGDGTEGDLSPLELREIVENDSPLNAAVYAYMCGMTVGARIERHAPGQVDLYHEPEETTAAEYKKELEKEAPGADQDEIDEDQELLALMFNDAMEKMTSGAFDIEQDVQFLKRVNGITRKAPFDLLVTGFLVGVLEAMQFDEKLHEEIKG